tara:strand:+ start:1153 stop:1560 length:408 start_codon:yes stop_codon:yes gene_type:complete
MINQDDLYRLIGMAFLLVIAVAIAMKALSYQRKIIEGMSSTDTSPSNIPSKISSDADQIDTKLAVHKNRTNYEDTIVQLEKVVSMTLLSEVINTAEIVGSDPTTSDAQASISTVNNLQNFRKTLNEAMIILDKIP